MFSQFNEISCLDFEYSATGGDNPNPVCMVAREYRTGRLLRFWRDELVRMTSAPFDVGRNSLTVAYFASADLGCFLSLGWSLPKYVMDPYAEFSCITNGIKPKYGRGLIGALMFFG